MSYANDRLPGSLGASIIVAPTDRRRLGQGFEKGTAAPRYGAIGFDAWCALGILAATATWSAFLGQEPRDVGSGTVHNALFISEWSGPWSGDPSGRSHA